MLWLTLQLRYHMRRSMLGLVGGVLSLIGLGFLLNALWYLLAIWGGPVAAAAILGILFVGFGLVMLAAARAVPRVPIAAPILAPRLSMLGLIEAFMAGMAAGSRTRRRRSE